MQYQITLPTDYDMQIIRDRVRTTGTGWTASAAWSSRRT